MNINNHVGKKLLVLVVTALFLGTALPAHHADAASSSNECFASDYHNTAKLDVAESTASILAGKHVNGTIGFIWLVNLPSDGNYSLVSPNGTEIGPVGSTAGEVKFADVPLCDTGTWIVQNNATGQTVSEFYTTFVDDSGLASIVIDYVINIATDRNYYAGWMLGEESGPSCSFEGASKPQDYPLLGENKVRVWADWETRYSGLLDQHRGIFTITAEGNYGKQATSIEADGSDSGKVSVFVAWTAFYNYVVELEVKQYDGLFNPDGYVRCTGIAIPQT